MNMKCLWHAIDCGGMQPSCGWVQTAKASIAWMSQLACLQC